MCIRDRQLTVGLTTLILSAAVARAAVPAMAAPAKKAATAVKYRAHCGMIYSAADAKKYHYICPMDHKPLVKITSGARKGKR